MSTDTIRYRSYTIRFDPPPIPDRNHDWQCSHDDYDGAPDSMDGRCFSGPTVQDCKDQIDEWEEDHA